MPPKPLMKTQEEEITMSDGQDHPAKTDNLRANARVAKTSEVDPRGDSEKVETNLREDSE